MPPWVSDIAKKFMREDLKHIDLVHGQEIKTSTTVEHLALLCPSPYHFISSISDVVNVYCGQHGRVIIFTETKQEANDVLLKANLKIEC
jgi:ATP-dependent RNA helicase DDX21